eukprot:13137444-Ditylum_brightwellii.AAC.1
MTQCSLGKGLKKFKEKAAEAVVEKCAQLHKKETFEPVKYEDIPEEDKDEALEALMLPKEKGMEESKDALVQMEGNKGRD